MPLTRAQSAAASRFNHFSRLDDDLIREILYRAPEYTHGLLTFVCKDFKKIITEPYNNYHIQRHAPVVLAFGGGDGFGYGHLHKHMLALVEGDWVYCSSPPVWGRDLYSAVLGKRFLMLIGGGKTRRYDVEPDDFAVHAYDVVEDYWIALSPRNPPKNRLGAVCAHAEYEKESCVYVVGGTIVDWASEDDDPYERTSSVLQLSVRQNPRSGELKARWSDLPPMPTLVNPRTAFVVDKRLHVLSAQQPDQSVARTYCLQALDLSGAAAWVDCAKPPPCLASGCGAFHSGRFFVLSFEADEESEDDRNGDRTPTVYTYAPGEDTWARHPPLPKPLQDSNSWTSCEPFRWRSIRGFSLTTCVSGLVVLDEHGGNTALLKVSTDGVITSVVTLNTECWSDTGISAFAQDHFLEGLNAATFELSKECRLLKEWAERIEEKQHMEEEMFEAYDDEEEELGAPQVEHLREAKLWLETSGLPDHEERMRRHRAQRESMSEEAKEKEYHEGLSNFLNWMRTGDMDS